MEWSTGSSFVAIIRPHRLLARYSPALRKTPLKWHTKQMYLLLQMMITTSADYTHMNTLANNKLYEEIFADAEYRGFKKWILGVLLYVSRIQPTSLP